MSTLAPTCEVTSTDDHRQWHGPSSGARVISLPIFERLVVKDYGLYPGTDDQPGLQIDFSPGLTLVLGANGLGKSTLILLLFRLCTGTTDLASLPRGNLGDRQFNLADISTSDRQTFGARVNDDGASASAELELSIGSTRFYIARSLRDLSLTALRIDDIALDTQEATFQSALTRAAGLTSFQDWILSLRYLAFYFDDRRSLVWDLNAQRQILRLLFLSPTESATWTALEREALSLDSEMRNLRNAVNRLETRLTKDEKQVAQSPETARELEHLMERQEQEIGRLEDAEGRLESIEAERNIARLDALRASEDRESVYRALEHARLEVLRSAFPTETESANYILSFLMAGDDCLACDSHVPGYAQELRDRIGRGKCVVCGSAIDTATSPGPPEDIEGLHERLQLAEDRAAETAKRRRDAEQVHSELLDEIAQLDASIATRSTDISKATDRLPGDQAEIRTRRLEYNSMKSNVERLRVDLDDRRLAFSQHVSKVNRRILERKEDIKAAFDEFAQDFLLEDIQLTWSNHRARIGQGGELIDYPSFRVEMAGTDFPTAVRRTDAEQVSESQREFIDLAFRMALMKVAATHGHSSLVVDAPESSLDAVFAPRAAKVLMRFGEPSAGNRLVVTSNLIDGALIPTMLDYADITTLESPKIVDLFRIASPTAAIRRYLGEYERVLHRLFEGSPQ